MILQNWWYTTLIESKAKKSEPLRGKLSCDVLIIGGGMAGLHAALYLADHGKEVVLLEKNICGGSSTGKSAGFLTPDSELELSQIIRRYGSADAKQVWEIPSQGVDLIADSITKYHIPCDFIKQDSLFVGIGNSGKSAVHDEAAARKLLRFPFARYDKEKIRAINLGEGYTGGIQYGGTYGINPLLYCQGLKDVLLKKGVKIFESTEVASIKDATAKTHLGEVKAKHIILCIDKINKNFTFAEEKTYYAQTFLSISEPLDNDDITNIFPQKNVMCWDSTLVYSYYRLTGDKRLLLGGGSALTTFLPADVTSPRIIQGVINNFKKRFPPLKHVEFIQYWPGRIDTTKDLIPIVDFDPTDSRVQYVLGCVGLPWAAFCGYYAARRLLDKSFCHRYCTYLALNRKYFVPLWMQHFFGKGLAFSLNVSYSKYIQKEKNIGTPYFH